VHWQSIIQGLSLYPQNYLKREVHGCFLFVFCYPLVQFLCAYKIEQRIEGTTREVGTCIESEQRIKGKQKKQMHMFSS